MNTFSQYLRSRAGLVILLLIMVTTAACGPKETPQQETSSQDTSWLLPEGTSPEVIADGFRFTEGPYWHADGYLIFSDIPANTVFRWSEDEGSSVFLEPSGNSNGITMDPDGHIVMAQHAGRVSRLGADGTPVPIVEQYEGMRLNSPNDLVYHSNGTLYFTDPNFGVSDENRELDFTGVFRLGTDGDLSVIYTEFDLPNGITLSPDESVLYFNDTATGNIVRMDVDADGHVSGAALFATVGERSQSGAADGMKTDTDGRVYSTGPGGLHVFDTNGVKLLLVPFDQSITNLAWGGPDRNELYITSRDKVYRLKTSVTGSGNW
ncbi:MAG: SMP-30/gluconolactonase/LRE family protein [Balneolaceae bacterium]|jgi:gluconolactonase|nr:MAG: SMP-30/gluconolactonase/LRE family protein [Balneolaceae bacterium]